MAFHLGNRARLALRYIGFVVLGLVTFVFALQLTFPYGRVKDKIVDALSEKYDVTIGSVDRGIIPGRMFFNAVSLRTRPAKSDEVATTFYIDKLEVDLGIVALIRGVAQVNIDAKIATGHLKGKIAISKGATEIDLEGVDLPSASLPMRDAIGLPLSGKIEFSFDLNLPNEKNKAGKVAPDWSKAEGAVSFECPSGCVFGDGKTKLKPKLKNARSAAFASDGIEFGKVNVDTMVARVTIKDGQLELTKFETKSADGELQVEYSMTLAPEFGESMVAGCLRFKGSEVLQKREPKTHAAISTTGAQLGPDNLFHIRLDGKFKDMRRLAQTCGPTTKGNMDDPGGTANTGGHRPNLTVQPEDQVRPTMASPPPIPPPPPMAPADAAVHVPAPGPVDEHNGSGMAGSGATPGSGEVPTGSGTAGAAGAGAAPPEGAREPSH
jgi:type II secretion system protein N